MKNLDILAIANSYATQKEKGDGLRLPAAVAWKRRINLDRIFKAKALIDDALKEVQQKFSDDDHSDPSDDGGRKVKAEFLPDFIKEQGDILTQETPVEIVKVKIEDIGDVALTDADMDTLAFMIEGGE